MKEVSSCQENIDTEAINEKDKKKLNSLINQTGLFAGEKCPVTALNQITVQEEISKAKISHFSVQSLSYGIQSRTLGIGKPEWLKEVKRRRDDRKVCKPRGRTFFMEINSVLFLLYESYEIKFPMKISSLQ